MRIPLVLLLLCGSAHADPELPHRAIGLALDVQDIDIGPARANGIGLDATAVLGHCRIGLIAEAGLGGLMATHPSDTVGLFGTARIGGRLLLASFAPHEIRPFGIDLVLDAGLAGELYSVNHGGGFVTQPSVFFGWGSVVHGDHHAVHIELRVSAAPKADDSAMVTAICRGTCGASNDAPVDFTITALMGVLSW